MRRVTSPNEFSLASDILRHSWRSFEVVSTSVRDIIQSGCHILSAVELAILEISSLFLDLVGTVAFLVTHRAVKHLL